jgi:hypothetical protein
MSTISADQLSLNEDLDEVEDKMPEIPAKKVCCFIDNSIDDFFCCRKNSIQRVIH